MRWCRCRKKAAEAGIPVVAFNQGLDQYKDAGAKMYFGSDELLAGQTIGQKITQEGGGKTLCVIQAQGSVALETRCQGVKEGFANTENLQVNGADLPSVQQTIGAKLTEDPSITHVVTLGAPIALAAIQAQGDTGQTKKTDHVRPEPGRGEGHPGRQDRVLHRPAALRAGLRGGGLAVADT